MAGYYDAKLVEEKLRDNAERVCEHLFPEGKLKGREWRVGGLDGSPGGSVKIPVSGSRVGVWSDYESGESGATLLNLWKESKGLEFKPALEEAAKFVGVKPQRHGDVGYRKPKRPKYVEDWVDMDPSSLAWKLAKGRGLSDDAVQRMKMTKDGKAVVFVHYSAEGAVDLVKYWGSNKRIWSQPDPVHSLYGKERVPSSHDGTIIISEGQWDAESYWEAGLPCVSIPSGCTNEEWVEVDWEWLQQFETIYLSFDMDDAGREALKRVTERLGAERCRDIQLELKDANDVLRASGAEDLTLAVDNALFIDPEELTSAIMLGDGVRELLLKDISKTGLPFQIPDVPIRFRMHESTIWTGYTGDGKSTVLRGLMVNAVAAHGETVCIADLESRPEMTMAQMIVQYTANGDIASNKGEFERQYERLASKIITYDNPVKAEPERVLDKFEYAYRRWGCRHFVLDNVMMLKIARQDLQCQADAAHAFKEFVKRYPVHLHVVAHPRKPPVGESPKPPSPYEVKGASDWCDISFNVVGVWRNKKKNEEVYTMREQGVDPMAVAEYVREVPDGKIVVGKQRSTGELPTVSYWFDTESYQIKKNYADDPIAYYAHAG